MVRSFCKKIVAVGEWLVFEFLSGYNETALMFTLLLLITSLSSLRLTAPSLAGFAVNALFFLSIRICVKRGLDPELGLFIASVYSLLAWELVFSN
ncbi:hypothetical protein ABMA09_22945 [Erwinia rhapontici]|uniref:hypothetical protein n=1 Tax=Erwinia rhapontici TaxID=55212 RepID=UPI003D368A26